MGIDLQFRRYSLKTRLIAGYVIVLAIGGLVTSVVGSWIVSSTIMAQARRSVNQNLATARVLYEHHLETAKLTVHLAASGTTLPEYLARNNRLVLMDYLTSLRTEAGFDFLTLAGPDGRVLVRSAGPSEPADDVSVIRAVAAARTGKVAAATEVLPAGLLGRENPALLDRARLRLVPTPHAKPLRRQEETSGMVLVAAAPVRAPGRGIRGILYGGILLNGHPELVDRVWEVIFKGDRFNNQDVGTVTLFQGDVRIATTVKDRDGRRALGTLVSAEVYDAVIGRGEAWRDRAFVVNDWYISGYEPIRNYDGQIVGILYVGLLEKAFTAVRDRVILSFFAIATLGFIVIIGITYYEIHRITRPIGELVEATRNIAAGQFDQEVKVATGEIGLLSASFNTMLKSLRQMRGDLEEWGRTLEQKVKERTDELVAMQAKVAQSDRLASLGKLAAGVAHEINNPLGGILSLTALSLEDMKEDDPNRENLQEVIHQTERCRDIVARLLDFARQSVAHKELVDVNRILEETLSLLTRQSLFFNIRVEKKLAPQLPPVRADRTQFQQVFMNILINAAQAMQEKGAVTVETRGLSPDGAVEVLISDTGCGIPPDRIGRIFDPFYTTKQDDQGTGLGLSIAYGIVTSHRGAISVESEVGRGTTFRITLPAASEVAEEVSS
jgi:two-component system NtrC family sensor kinase